MESWRRLLGGYQNVWDREEARQCVWFLIWRHLSALMGWRNGPSMPRWPSWSERRALMMLNYVNIILNRLFNEVTGFADQHTATLGPNIPPVPSLWTRPLCDNIKHFNGLKGLALLHLPCFWKQEMGIFRFIRFDRFFYYWIAGREHLYVGCHWKLPKMLNAVSFALDKSVW